MSRTIHGDSHKALSLFREHPAALAVFWDYTARANGENVAWPSVRGLSDDTDWSAKECYEARLWLVQHGALVEVSDYVRPKWRDLPAQERAQKLNFDKAKYFRPTGVLTINGVTHDLLYVVSNQEADPHVDTEGTDVLRDSTSEATDVLQGSTSDDTHRCTTGVDISPGSTELVLNKRTELGSSEKQSPKGDPATSTATQSMQPDGAQPFAIGQAVWWQHKPRGGYGFIDLIPATVVKYTAKRVTIEVTKKDGVKVERSVAAESLSIEKPSLTRPDDPLLDVLLEFGWQIPRGAPVAEALLQLARDVKAVLLVTYPDLNGARLRMIYQDYAPKTPNKPETVMLMIGHYLKAHPEARVDPDPEPVSDPMWQTMTPIEQELYKAERSLRRVEAFYGKR